MENKITYKKTIKQFAIIENDFDDLLFIFKKYNKIKKYIYSRYSGINSILTIKNSNKNIRDVWMKNGMIDSWSINRRYVRSAISDATSNIKSIWSNLKNTIKKHINNDKNLSNDDKHYIRYVLKSDEIFYDILNHKEINVSDKFNGLNKTKLNVYIRRITRLYKPNISNPKNLTMNLENEIYSYKNGYINIMGLVKNKRLSFKVNTNNVFNGTINLKLNDDKRLTISRAINCKCKDIELSDNIIGIDKNFINVIDTSNETSYGIGLNKLQIEYANEIKDKNKKRNYYHSKIKELRKSGTEVSKIENINKNNLGKKKYFKTKNRHKEGIKNIINKGLNEFILTEKPKIIGCEDISFTYSKHRNRIKEQGGSGRGKKVNLYLNQWMKGYINDRLIFKATQNNIELRYVNAAYTSQTCSISGHLGVRVGEWFYSESSRGGVYSGYNSAKIIKGRVFDNEITLGMSPIKVKAIIERRLVDKNSINKPNQPRPIEGANYPNV